MTPQQIRSKAESFARETIKLQKQTFQSWGIIGDWDNAYTTMGTAIGIQFFKVDNLILDTDPQYEAKQLEVFEEFFKKGLIYRGLKPVHWSPSSKTALAESELEYSEDHISPSIYVKFPVISGICLIKFSLFFFFD